MTTRGEASQGRLLSDQNTLDNYSEMVESRLTRIPIVETLVGIRDIAERYLRLPDSRRIWDR